MKYVGRSLLRLSQQKISIKKLRVSMIGNNVCSSPFLSLLNKLIKMAVENNVNEIDLDMQLLISHMTCLESLFSVAFCSKMSLFI